MASGVVSPPERRLSLLIQLRDTPGALQRGLRPFTRHAINLTHIESRPAQNECFDFYVDCEAARGEAAIEATIAELEAMALKLLVLDHKHVPWFPRRIAELDLIANNTLDAGVELQARHPGFHDPVYRQRRADIDALARGFRHGQPLPVVDYVSSELATWGTIYPRLRQLHETHGCIEYRRIIAELEQHCGYSASSIPQISAVSEYLSARTGFQIRPVAGLLGARDFLNGLAFRVFFATQYIRHHSKPLYTPEPDVVHELIGHAPMFADPAFADLSQEIGLASLGASDRDIERLAACYWHSVEFGLLRERGRLKAYGAGLLSSSGELEHAVAQENPAVELRDWDPDAAAAQGYPITEYQPVYFVARSLQQAKQRMRAYCENLPRPFHARYNPVSESIWVDRAVTRKAG
jgi:phenylalanine-4-hydroxylase